MRTIFEAYLTEKDDKYLLYLDKFHFSELFNSIGVDEIQKIRIIHRYLSEDHGINDEVIYAGIGEIPNMIDVDFSRDSFEKIIINENIELFFHWWEDVLILADLETICKCINGQKILATAAQSEILDRLPDSKNTYFKVKDEILIASQQMNLDEFDVLLFNAYPEKEEQLSLSCWTDEEREEFYNTEIEPRKLNLCLIERQRLKSGLQIFTFIELSVSETREIIACPYRIGHDEFEFSFDLPSLIVQGSDYRYSEHAHVLHDDLSDEYKYDKFSKKELVMIKEFYDKFKFPDTHEGNNDENDFFDALSELYQIPSEDESQELISKYHKYYNHNLK